MGALQLSERRQRGPVHIRSSIAMIKCISAITLATHDMARAVQFYRALGFAIAYGGETAAFTSFRAGTGYLNLITERTRQWSWWGRVIFHHSDVDGLYARAVAAACIWRRRRAMPNGASDIST
jgi:catechol-2,3-dioxygenase